MAGIQFIRSCYHIEVNYYKLIASYEGLNNATTFDLFLLINDSKMNIENKDI
jgi:hypothetical protein